MSAHDTGWKTWTLRPRDGNLAACWDQRPLCLYTPDWLSELWSVLYLRPTCTAGTLAGQAEWQTRLLSAAADRMARETAAAHTAAISGPAAIKTFMQKERHCDDRPSRATCGPGAGLRISRVAGVPVPARWHGASYQARVP